MRRGKSAPPPPPAEDLEATDEVIDEAEVEAPEAEPAAAESVEPEPESEPAPEAVEATPTRRRPVRDIPAETVEVPPAEVESEEDPQVAKVMRHLIEEGGEAPEERRKKLPELLRSSDGINLEVARLLWQVNGSRNYEEWGFEKFEDYVEQELGFKKRKGQYLIGIWETFRKELGVPLKKLERIGWSKLAMIEPVVNAKNVDEWLKLARELSYAELQKKVDAQKGKDPKDSLVNLTVKVTTEQKENIASAIGLAGVEAGQSDAAGYCLDLIATEWLAGHAKPSEKLQSCMFALERVFGVTLFSVPSEHGPQFSKVFKAAMQKLVGADDVEDQDSDLVAAPETDDDDTEPRAPADEDDEDAHEEDETEAEDSDSDD